MKTKFRQFSIEEEEGSEDPCSNSNVFHPESKVIVLWQIMKRSQMQNRNSFIKEPSL
jgi:hypothetical protein